MNNQPADLVAAQALLYASGELDAEQERAFERVLAQEQPAREALRRATQVVFKGRLEGMGRPDPAYRQRVQKHVLPAWPISMWKSPMFRGRPAFWTAMGVAAVLLVLGINGRLDSERLAPRLPPPPGLIADEPMQMASEDDMVSTEQAEFWAELLRDDHLQKAHEEELRRRQQAGKLDRLLKADDNRLPRAVGRY